MCVLRDISSSESRYTNPPKNKVPKSGSTQQDLSLARDPWVSGCTAALPRRDAPAATRGYPAGGRVWTRGKHTPFRDHLVGRVSRVHRISSPQFGQESGVLNWQLTLPLTDSKNLVGANNPEILDTPCVEGIPDKILEGRRGTAQPL